MSTHNAFGLMAFGLPGTTEWLVILVLGLLIFGRRLPEIARSVGKSIVEFKKGVRDVEGQIDDSSSTDRQQRTLPPSNDASPQRSAPRDTADMHEHGAADSSDSSSQATKSQDSDAASG